MKIEKGDFKGHPVLAFTDEENKRNLLTIGLRKAKLIVEQIEEIKKFIQENEK